MRTTFGKFPQAVNEINKPIILSNGTEKKFSRAQWVANNHPDFDVFVDDNPFTLQELISHFPNKTFVVPDYKMNQGIKGKNVYRFPVQPIALKNQDFAIGALELKNKQLEKEIKAATTKNNFPS